MENRKLYKGTFNWYGEKIEEYVRAYTPEQAMRLMCSRIGAGKDRTGSSVRMYFSKGDRYKITEVKEDGK